MQNDIIRLCARVASQFTGQPNSSIHPDLKWDDMNESAKVAAHITAQQIAEAILEMRQGTTLADFANSNKLFKRPKHGNPYGFTAHDNTLTEIHYSTWGGQINIRSDFPRLTREDLTATDWEEFTLPKEVEEYRASFR